MQDLRSALQSARRLHQSGAGSVLDALMRSLPFSPAELADQLQRHAGVTAIFTVDQAQVDFSALSEAACRSIGCVPVRLNGDTAVRVALSDPWNDELVRHASAALGFV